MKTGKLLSEIARLQGIQKRNPPTSEAWKSASKALKPLFAEMAKRQNEGRVIFI